MNILVTGIGGDIGNGIGRILRECGLAKRLVGCDIHNEHIGHQIFDVCKVIPRATSAEYLHAVRDLVAGESIDAVIVGSEPELRFFFERRASGDEDGLPIVTANQQSLAIGFDKLKTAEFVSKLGLPAPWTSSVRDSRPKTLPCILKNRFGAGGQGVYVVRDPKQVESFAVLFPDYIWQEYLPGDANEFTCGLYGCRDGEVRVVVFRRRLGSGITTYAEVDKNQAIEALCHRIAKGLSLSGSINVQLRLTERGPMVFEINPRFSSTVVFRHKLGFMDVVWSIQEQILGEQTSYNDKCATGSKVYRVFGEHVDRS